MAQNTLLMPNVDAIKRSLTGLHCSEIAARIRIELSQEESRVPYSAYPVLETDAGLSAT